METLIQQYNSNIEEIKNIKVGQNLSFKAADIILESTNIDLPLEVNVKPLPYVPIKDKVMSVLDYFPKVAVNSHTLVIGSENSTGNNDPLIAIGEGVAKTPQDFNLSALNIPMTKYASSLNVSREMIDDIGYMQRMISHVLTRDLKEQLATDFIGDIFSQAGMDSGDLTAGAGGTQLKDMLPAISADMKNKMGYNTNLWLLNQPDYAMLFNEPSVNLLWYALNSPKIITSGAVTATNILAVDTSVLPIYIYKDMNVTIGYVNDDFTKNMLTVVAETRVAWVLTDEQKKAIYKDTISNTLTAIA